MCFLYAFDYQVYMTAYLFGTMFVLCLSETIC